MTSGLVVAVGQHSQAGCKPVNQDFHGAIIPGAAALALKGAIFAVADGISSSSVSHIAAESAVKSVLTDYYCTSDAWSVKTAVHRVVSAVNSWLHAQTRRSGPPYDMDNGYVCTLAAMVLKGRRAHLFHVGDTRIYRLTGDSLEQLTEDHRVVLSSEENYLGRALGMAREVEIDYRTLDLRAGDCFLLTTDGIHEHLHHRELARMVAGAEDLDLAACDVAEAALANGSQDNLTVQVVRIDGLPDADSDFMAEVTSLPPPHDPRSDIDGYRLVRPIHSNNRSHIYLATEPETGVPVALKIPSTDLRGDSGYLRRLMMEEWIARRINSPHVLRAAVPPRERRFLYAVTEYIEGQTLRQWMHDNPRPDLETVRTIVEQIARGLRAFHRKEMLHQDLRPENVMLDRAGTVKIIDFGSVWVAGVAEAAPALADGGILGTLQYTAPEYFLGAPGTPRSDLFSLGVIAYEMLTGRLPYGARVSRASSRKAQAKLRYVPAAGTGGEGAVAIPPWVDGALRRAVHPDPRKRQGDAGEFAADLRRPNPDLVSHGPRPLMERDPLLFWKVLSFLLALALLVVLAVRR